MILAEGLQDPQIRQPEVITGDGYDHTLLGCPDGELAGGLLQHTSKVACYQPTFPQSMPEVIVLLPHCGCLDGH